MKYNIPALLILISLLSLGYSSVFAQVGSSEIKHRRVRVGFFAGPANYIGDYNAGLFGSDVAIDDEASIPSENFSGDLDFGVWTKIMIKEFLYVRGNAGFGTLTFSISELDHNMNTSYKNFGLGLEASIFNQKALRPYLTAGISTLNFAVPLTNNAQEFESFNISEQGSTQSGIAIPIGLGIDYKISRLTTLFFETNLTLTDRDDLDNIALPSSRTNAPFTNDAFISYRFGIGFSAIELFKLAFKTKEVKQTKPVTLFTPTYDDTLVYNRVKPRSFIPSDTIEIDKRRVFPEFYDFEEPYLAEDATDQIRSEDEQQQQSETEQQRESDNTTQESDTETIRSFDDGNLSTSSYVKEQLALIDNMQVNAYKMSQRQDNPDLKQAFRDVPQITREPFIVYQQPDSNIVTNNPPPGYYVLSYTSVGPESTANAQKTILSQLQNKVANANQRVFVTKREEFYEVRVGVFKDYEVATKVVDMIRGTFFDAFILFYAKD